MIISFVRRGHRAHTTLLAVGLLVCTTFPAVAIASSTHAGDSKWRLSKSLYPAGVKTEVDSPTNANTQFLFGGLHSHTFKALKRIDNAGWLQVVQSKTKKKIGLDWAYGVSMFPSTATAMKAAHDFKGKFKSLPGVGSFGGTSNGIAAGYYYTYSVFGSGKNVIDQFCFADQKETSQGKAKLDSFCLKQRSALAGLLAK